MHLAAHLFLPPVVPHRNPERPDRTRRPGRDESDPPVFRTSFGTPLPSPFHSSFHVRAGVAPGRTDPCGKASRPDGAYRGKLARDGAYLDGGTRHLTASSSMRVA